MPKILLLQGPNLVWLGRREPHLYGTTSAAELDAMCRAHAVRRGYELEIFYSNVEGFLIDRIYRAVGEGFDHIVINPAGCSQGGYALRDCLKAVSAELPAIEVHITHMAQRGIEPVTTVAAVACIFGFGLDGYLLALEAALMRLGRPRPW